MWKVIVPRIVGDIGRLGIPVVVGLYVTMVGLDEEDKGMAVKRDDVLPHPEAGCPIDWSAP